MVAENTAQGPILNLQLSAYGSSADDPPDESRFNGEEQRRVEIDFEPVIPAKVVGNLRRMQDWARDIVRGLMLEVKHSNQWHCEFCTDPARESHIYLSSWMHMTPPKVLVYVHLLCNARDGDCFEHVKEVEKVMASMGGHPPENYRVAQVPEAAYSVAAACTKCERETTEDKTLSRCGRCKLARYCSKECQTADWSRHKANCKATREVKWVWN